MAHASLEVPWLRLSTSGGGCLTLFCIRSHSLGLNPVRRSWKMESETLPDKESL